MQSTPARSTTTTTSATTPSGKNSQETNNHNITEVGEYETKQTTPITQHSIEKPDSSSLNSPSALAKQQQQHTFFAPDSGSSRQVVVDNSLPEINKQEEEAAKVKQDKEQQQQLVIAQRRRSDLDSDNLIIELGSSAAITVSRQHSGPLEKTISQKLVACFQQCLVSFHILFYIYFFRGKKVHLPIYIVVVSLY